MTLLAALAARLTEPAFDVLAAGLGVCAVILILIAIARPGQPGNRR